DWSVQAASPTAATSRLPAVIVPPGASALSFHRAYVPPVSSRAAPAAPATMPVSFLFMEFSLPVLVVERLSGGLVQSCDGAAGGARHLCSDGQLGGGTIDGADLVVGDDDALQRGLARVLHEVLPRDRRAGHDVATVRELCVAVPGGLRDLDTGHTELRVLKRALEGVAGRKIDRRRLTRHCQGSVVHRAADAVEAPAVVRVSSEDLAERHARGALCGAVLDRPAGGTGVRRGLLRRRGQRAGGRRGLEGPAGSAVHEVRGSVGLRLLLDVDRCLARGAGRDLLQKRAQLAPVRLEVVGI